MLKNERFAEQREQMVESQLSHRGITDRRVLRAMASVPRELFVPEKHRRRAYTDHALPIGEGQSISQPWVVAYMAEALRLQGIEKVLEVGAGSGYAATILGQLAAEVWTLERWPSLAEEAAALIGGLGYENVHVICRDGHAGLPEEAPFGGISVAATAPSAPQALLDQLADGGRLICPLASKTTDWLTLHARRGEKIEAERLVPCRFVPLVGEPEDLDPPGRTTG